MSGRFCRATVSFELRLPATLRAFYHDLVLVLVAALTVIGCNDPAKLPISSATVDKVHSDAIPAMRANPPQIETLARFSELTEANGVRFMFQDGQEAGHYAILESLGGGVALFDYDGDGALDIFLPGGGGYGPHNEILGRSGALFHNVEDRTFHEVTSPAGVQEAPYYSHGTAVGDYDDDGFPDLLVTGYGGLLLFHNQGDGTFVESARRAGLTDDLWSSSAAWGDVNGDGVLDLYVAHYVNWSFANDPVCHSGNMASRDVCPPKKFEGLPHLLYAGVGDGTFRDISRQAGLEPRGDLGKGLGVLIADVDLDGDLDIYVANDTVPKFLYRNKGDGTFDEIGGQSGTALSATANPDGSMGLDIGDFNLDGLPDLWVANYERESLALYRNEGDCQFLHVSNMTGVTAVGTQFVSFGTLFFDFDRDGDEDVFVTNGHVTRTASGSQIRQLPLLLENRSGRFLNVASAAGPCLSVPHLGRGVASGDLDGNGSIDLVLSPINEPTSVLMNESTNENHWLRVRLVGVKSHRDAIGAHLTLTTSAGQQTRQVKGGGSYLSQSELHCFFGIPANAKFEKLSIRWPSGILQELTDLAADRQIIVVEELHSPI